MLKPNHSNHLHPDLLLRTDRARENWDKIRSLQMIQRFLIFARKSVLNQMRLSEFPQYKTEQINQLVKGGSADSYLKSLFDLLISLINIYLSYSIPFRLAFYADHQVNQLYIQDLVLDSVLFCSFLINFFAARTQDKSLELFNRKNYLNNLFHFSFYCEIFSIIPLYMVHTKYYWFKVGRIYMVNSFIIWVDSSFIPQRFLKIFMMKYYGKFQTVITVLWYASLIMIVCHCVACLWYYIPNHIGVPAENTWLAVLPEDSSINDMYMASLYWTAVTVSSVGYGDITGKTTQEYLFSMFIEFLGIMGFSFMMGSVSNLINSYYSKKEEAKFRENELHNWLVYIEESIRDKDIQTEIREKVTMYFSQKWKLDPKSLSNFEDYYNMLPPLLAKQLADHIFSPRLVIFKSFISYFPEIKYKFAQILKSENLVSTGELIKCGDKNKRIYFIVNGTFAVGQPEDGYALKLESGSFFGEDTALFGDESFLSFYNKEEFSLIHYAEISDIKKVLKDYRDHLVKFARYSFRRAKYFLDINKFRYGSGYYVTDAELLKYMGGIDLDELVFNMEEEEEFQERARSFLKELEGVKKENSNPLTSIFMKKMNEESQVVKKNIQEINRKYEREIQETILKIDEVINEVMNRA